MSVVQNCGIFTIIVARTPQGTLCTNLLYVAIYSMLDVISYAVFDDAHYRLFKALARSSH